MKKYTIYKLESPSGKIYIGQTCDIKRRLNYYKWKCSCTKNQTLLYNSISKYGFDSHKIELLFIDLSKDDANIKEIELIRYYKELKVSLNICDGGYDINSNSKKIKILQFDLNGNKIQSFDSYNDAERILNINSLANAIKLAIKKKLYYSHGYLWITESLFNKGEFPIYKRQIMPFYNSKKVYAYTLNKKFIGEYKSIAECSRELKIANASISKCLSGKKYANYRYIFTNNPIEDNIELPLKIKKQNQPFGENHSNTMLKEDDIVKIRQLYDTGNYTFKEIGVMFNITKTTTINIVKRKTWKHVI